MKLKSKFFIAFCVLLLIMISTSGFMYVMNQRLTSFYDELVHKNELLTDLRETQFVMAGHSNDERGYLLTGTSSFRDGMAEKEKQLETLFVKLRESGRATDSERASLQKIEQLYRTYTDFSATAVKFWERGDQAEARQFHFGKGMNARLEMDKAVNAFVEEVALSQQEIQQRLADQQVVTGIVQLVAVVASILFAILIGAVLVRSIVTPLRRVNEQLRAIAEGEGDLTQELQVSTKDEIGMLADSFNRMLRNLRELIIQIKGHAQQVAASAEQLTASSEQTSKATEQISATMQELAAGTDSQAQSVEIGYQEVGQMTADISQIASRAEHVASTALRTSELAADGNQTIQSAVAQMHNISETMIHLADLVGKLGNRSQQIGEIVNGITEIAAQTNLLALNAAIEAARAGEHGRGFAVVADEVRKLAEQSASFTHEITQLVEIIQSETTQAVASMQTGKEEVESGMQGVSKAGEVFSQIRAAVDGVVAQVQDVFAASRTLTESTEKVAQSMQMISNVTQTSVSRTLDVSAAAEEQLASMEEIYTSSSSLARLAEELERSIGRFKV